MFYLLTGQVAELVAWRARGIVASKTFISLRFVLYLLSFSPQAQQFITVFVYLVSVFFYRGLGAILPLLPTDLSFGPLWQAAGLVGEHHRSAKSR